ncbi:hypothetical protein TWF730_010010 [Orbilia blumenaviensis]|uniref:Uncharacterized protein n=1 Tax=Orbilia blumenaviensis TaxID=1796055 RepID=A0AAV9UTF8_9PEZI
MQWIHLLSILAALGGTLAHPAGPLAGHESTPAKREPSLAFIDIVYEATTPKLKPEPRPIHVGPAPEPRPIHILPVDYTTSTTSTTAKTITKTTTTTTTTIEQLPRPTRRPKKGPKWSDYLNKVGPRATATRNPDEVHILPFPEYPGIPDTEKPEDPEPEPNKKPLPTKTTTRTKARAIATSTYRTSSTRTATKTSTRVTTRTTVRTTTQVLTTTVESKALKWSAKVRPPYYQPGYGVDEEED